jgi:hypothetical protein
METLILRIGRRHRLEVTSLAEASRIYGELRDDSGEGASTFPDGRVGHYRISYNGRVWDGKIVVQEAVYAERARA